MITYTVKNDENEYVLEDSSDRQLSPDDYYELINLAEEIGADYYFIQHGCNEYDYPITITIIQDGQKLGTYEVNMYEEPVFSADEYEIDES